MVMNNLSGSTKTEMTFGSENKPVHATIKFESDSFRVLNKDGSLAYIHTAQGTTSDSAVTMGYLDAELKRIESQQSKITSSDEVNMVHYNEESGTLGVNNVSADRIAGLTKNRVLITDENGVVTTSSIAKGQLQKLPNVPDDTNAELEKKADVDHTHTIESIDGLQDALDSKALVEHTHDLNDLEGADKMSVHHADYADEADSAKTDVNGTPIADYVRNVTVQDNKVTVTKGNGNVEVTQYVETVVPATETSDGKPGLVPAPCRADAGKFLSATGTWEKPTISLEDSGINLTPEEINTLPNTIDAVDSRVDEAEKAISTLSDEMTQKIDTLSEETSESISQLTNDVSEKAEAVHTHAISDITDLQTTLDNISSDVDTNTSEIEAMKSDMETKLSQKADVEHVHDIEDVTGLQDALDEKANEDHTHTIDQISDIADAKVAEATKATQDANGKAITEYVSGVSTDGSNLKITKGDGSSSTVVISTEGTYAEFTGATASEDGTFGLVPAPKAGDQNKVLSGAGTWVDAPVPDLGAAGITATSEELNYVSGVTAPIQTQLDEKAAAVHTHTSDDVTDFADAAKTALQSDLDAKADAEHTHEMGDVTGLEDALGTKADATHTHTISEITDIADAQVAKATGDKNGKDISTYVADVTSEDSKIKVTKGDGSSSEIALPESVTYSNFTGASAEAEGSQGLVPAPAMGDQDKFLKADGTWGTPVDTDTTYEVATEETAGLVKPSSEIAVADDGAMTVNEIAQSKVTGLEDSFAKMSQASDKFEVVDGVFDDTRITYRGSEVRVMYSQMTPWAAQEETDDPEKFFMTLRAYAPDNAYGYKSGVGESISGGDVTPFGGTVDELGRKYVEAKLPVATYSNEDAAWTYMGASSSAGKFIGWYYTVEWYNDSGKIIGSETIRINLANEDTFNSYIPGYMGEYAKTAEVTSALEGKSDVGHTHTVSEITDLDLSAATVAEAGKATSDKNGKDITEYVSDVTLEDTTITVSKGDGSSSKISLPEGTVYGNFSGTDGESAGTAGLVPAPQVADKDKFLKADGTWASVETGDVTVPVATTDTAGIVKASTEIAVDGTGTMSITSIDQSKITGLTESLEGKADSVHTHETADVNGLDEALAGKAEATHTHEISEVNNLQTSLDGKAALSHTHIISEIADIADATVKAATEDGSGKAINTYVADVTSEESKIKVTKGDGSSTEIPLPEGKTYEDFTGSTAEAEGTSGLVPAPAMGDQDKFLKADGTWGTPVDTNTTYEIATSDTVGLVKPSDEVTVDPESGAMGIGAVSQDKVTGLTDSLAGKADSVHTHTITDLTDITVSAEQINALPDAVSGKAEANHTHEAADITDLASATVAEAGKVTNAMTVTFNGGSEEGETVTFDGSAPQTVDITAEKVGAAEKVHTHTTADVTDLTETLATKADATHTHAISDVTDLETTLEGKASSVHTHEIADVNGLQDALDLKLEADDIQIATGDTTGVVKGSSEISVGADGALSVTSIEQTKVTGLDTALSEKANATHTHTISEITDIADAKVAEATKATQDTNGKAITDYVSSVTAEDSKITVTKGDGSSSEITLPEGTVYGNFSGTNGESAGTSGLVPAPQTTDKDKFLKSDGTWATVETQDVTVPIATSGTAGIVKPSDEISVAAEDGAMSIVSVSMDKVTGLNDALDQKLNTTDLKVATDAAAGIVKGTTEVTVGEDGSMTIGAIETSKVTGLDTALAGKADSEHTHEAADITDLASATVAEAGKVTNAFTITLNGGEGEGASSTFDGSSAQSMDITADKIGAASKTHTHTTADITDLADTLATKADATHTHEIDSVNGLQDALDAKLNTADLKVATTDAAGIVKTSSEIAVADDGAMSITAVDQTKVTGLTDALGNKADADHTHTMTDITDLDLSSATVAEATKATSDKNSKDITTYVADVTSEDSKIKVTKGDGSSSEISLPESVTYSNFTGASAEAEGSNGLVPAPAMGDQDKFLKADGTWAAIDIPEETPIATNDTTGVVKGSTEISVGADGALTVTSIEQAKVTGLDTALSGKADASHTHEIENVNGLQDALDLKLNSADLKVATGETAGIVKGSSEISIGEDGAVTVTAIDQSKVTGLTDSLAGKAESSHTHTTSEITDIADATVKAASEDTKGNALTSYVKNLSLAGSTITVTKGDDTTSEIEIPAGEGTSDPFTGTDGSSNGTAGLVPAPQTTDKDKFLSSDGTWKVVEGAGGASTIKYVSQVPATATVGGISEGYTPPSDGIDILDLIYKLLHPYVAPTLTATMLPRNGGTVGVATTQNITGVRVNLQKASGNKIMSYQVYDVDSGFDDQVPLGELYADDYENGFSEGAQTVTLNSPYQMTSDSPHKYLTVRVMDLDGNETVIKTASFSFVETYYWGVLPKGTEMTAEAIISDADKTSQASAKGTKTVSVEPNQEYVYFAAPKSYGKITSVKDSNNFENFETFNNNMVELNINGRDYYVYRSEAFSGPMTYTFYY